MIKLKKLKNVKGTFYVGDWGGTLILGPGPEMKTTRIVVNAANRYG